MPRGCAVCGRLMWNESEIARGQHFGCELAEATKTEAEERTLSRFQLSVGPKKRHLQCVPDIVEDEPYDLLNEMFKEFIDLHSYPNMSHCWICERKAIGPKEALEAWGRKHIEEHNDEGYFAPDPPER